MHPDTFESILSARLGQRFRLRFDQRNGLYHLEQKVARATEIPPQGDEFARQRVADGYWLVMTFSASPTLKCWECGSRIMLPVMDTAEVRCAFCDEHHESFERKLWHTGYYPLCDALIARMERLSISKRGTKGFEEEAAKSEAIRRAQQRDRDQFKRDVVASYWHQFNNTPRVGYGSGGASLGRL